MKDGISSSDDFLVRVIGMLEYKNLRKAPKNFACDIGVQISHLLAAKISLPYLNRQGSVEG